MFRGSFILFSVLLFSARIFPQDLSFFYERIEMTVSDSNFTITGKYLFENKNKREFRTSLYYPFVVSDSFSYPDSILVLSSSNIPSAYSKTKEGIIFPIKIHAEDTSGFTAFYRQKIFRNKAEYILTTTQNWKGPLKEAEYIINLPLNYNLNSISLKPDRINTGLQFKTYYINKKNFMPKNNLIVEWERSEK